MDIEQGEGIERLHMEVMNDCLIFDLYLKMVDVAK
jgi:hypothetical protein